MIQRFLPTLLAVAVLAAGVWYVKTYESDDVPDRDAAESVVVQDKDALSKIEIESTKDGKPSTIVFEKDAAKKEWWLVRPLKSEVDSITMDDLLGKLSKLESKRVASPKVGDAKVYGLDAPERRIKWTSDKGSGEILIGKKSLVEASTYVQKVGVDKVYMVESYSLDVFGKEPNGYRNKSVIKFDADGVNLVEVSREKDPRTFKRTDKENWTIEKPRSMKAQASSVKNMLFALSGLTASEFVSDAPTAADLTKFGLDKPTTTVTIGFEKADQGTRKLLIGKKNEGEADKVYVKRDGADTVYLVAVSGMLDLDKPLEDFKDKKLFAFDSVKLKKLTISRGSRTAQLTKDDKGNWSFANPIVRKEAHTAASVLAKAIEGLTAKTFTTEEPGKAAEYKLSPPALEIGFEGEGIPATQLTLGADQVEKGRFVKCSSEPFLFVPEEDLFAKGDAVVKAWAQFLELDTAKAQTLKVTKGTDSISLKRDEKDGFKVEAPAGISLLDPPGRATRLLEALSGLSADEFVEGTGAAAEVGLETPEYVIEVGLKDGAQIKLDLGPARNGVRGLRTSLHARIGKATAADLMPRLLDISQPFEKAAPGAPSHGASPAASVAPASPGISAPVTPPASSAPESPVPAASAVPELPSSPAAGPASAAPASPAPASAASTSTGQAGPEALLAPPDHPASAAPAPK